MKWTKLVTLAILATSTSASARKLKKKVWQSDNHEANSTLLIACVGQIRTDLEQNPLKNRIRGYECGGHWWQYGNVHINRDMKDWPSLAGFKTCEDDLIQAAYNGTSWFQCKVQRGHWIVYRYVAYSPLGYEACFWKHVPCEPDSKEVYDG